MHLSVVTVCMNRQMHLTETAPRVQAWADALGLAVLNKSPTHCTIQSYLADEPESFQVSLSCMLGAAHAVHITPATRVWGCDGYCLRGRQ